MNEHKDGCQFDGFECCVNRKHETFEISLEVCQEEIHFYFEGERENESKSIKINYCPSCGIPMNNNDC